MTLRDAQTQLVGRGDQLGAAELGVPLSTALKMSGHSAEAMQAREQARPLLEANPGPGLVALLATETTTTDETSEALARADAALALAEALGLPEPPLARIVRGVCLLELGDRSGEEETRRGIDLARMSGDLRQALSGFAKLAWTLTEHATMQDALAVYDEGLELARDHGLDDLDLRANRLDALEYAGRHDAVLEEVGDLKARAVHRGNAYAAVWCDMEVASIRMMRGEAVDDPEGLVEAARNVGFPRTGFVQWVARPAIARNDRETARRLIVEALDDLPEGGNVFAAIENVGLAVDLGDLDLARRVMSRAVPPGPTGRGYLSMLARAILIEAEGDRAAAHADFAEAGAYFTAHGWVWYRANALAGAGRSLVAMGQVGAGLKTLGEARALAESLRAATLIAGIDAVIEKVPGPAAAL